MSRMPPSVPQANYNQQGKDDVFVVTSSNDTEDWELDNVRKSTDDWQQLSDPTSGYQYWNNSRTGESTWEEPWAQAKWSQLETSYQPDSCYYSWDQREGSYEAITTEQHSDMGSTENQLALVDTGQSEKREDR